MDGCGRSAIDLFRGCSQRGYFNSTGNQIESAKRDFWKEGEERSGKSAFSSKPAVPGTVPFIGPWVRALFS